MPSLESGTSSNVAVSISIVTAIPDTLTNISTCLPLLVALITRCSLSNDSMVFLLAVSVLSSMMAVITSGTVSNDKTIISLLLSGSSKVLERSNSIVCGNASKIMGSNWLATTGGWSSTRHSTTKDVSTACPLLVALSIIVDAPSSFKSLVIDSILPSRTAETRLLFEMDTTSITMFSSGSSGSVNVFSRFSEMLEGKSSNITLSIAWATIGGRS